jgi:hypothetical protein
MRKKPTTNPSADQQLLEALNQHPQLKERLLAIVRLAEGQEGTPRTADEIETLLVEEVRQLGRETMTEWAQAQARRVAREVGQEHPRSYRSKKKD